ncbi:MAG: CDP-alcohol phosphatidyltransferase family protein [Anaerolineaceae bacterium]|nr:CDP-alcohol phosphatidyltransferase family protein [Anaerolineaceae bacterium]
MEKESPTLTDTLRVLFRGMFEPIAAFLTRLGLKPNSVTIFGLIGHGVAAILIAQGMITIGGLLLIIMAPIDYLDGMMARMRGESSRFGAFVDSVTDRYSEFVVLGGLLFYFLQRQDWVACGLVYLAVTGSVLVSYVRTRAEALGYQSKVGLLTRVERYLVLIPALVFNRPMIALWILAIFGHLTAFQRILNVRRQAYEDDSENL